MKITKKNKKILLIAIIITISLGVGFLIFGKINKRGYVSTKYTIGKVSIGSIRSSLSTTGQVYSSEEQDIKSNVNSTVITIQKKKGDIVKEGDIIAILDSDNITNDLLSAQISLEKAQNNYEEAIKPLSETDRIKLETSLQSVKNTLTKLEVDQPIELENAENSVITAEKNLQNSYDSALGNIDSNFSSLTTLINDARKILYLTDTLNINDILNNENSNFDLDNYLNVEIPFYWDSVINSSIFDYDTDKEAFIDLIKRATANYKIAKNNYDSNVILYRKLNKNSSNEEIEYFLNKTLELNNNVFNTFRDLNSVYNYYIDYNNQRLRSIYHSVNSYNSTLKSDVNTINSLLLSIKSAQDSLAKAKDNVRSSKINLEKLKIDQPIELETAKNNVKIQQANYNETIKGISDLEKRSYQLSINQAKANLTSIQETMSKYIITAPFDGVISKMDLSVGDNVSSNTSIATIISNHSVAKLTFNEVDIAKIKEGQKADLTFDALEDIKLTGTVSDVDSTGTTSAGVVYYTVQIAFDSENESIKPGMSVTADIILENKENVLVVPNSAIKTFGENNYVEILENIDDNIMIVDANEKNTPVRKNIKIGVSDDSNTEIISGLSENDSIITRTTIVNLNTKNTSSISNNSITNMFNTRSTQGNSGGNRQNFTPSSMPSMPNGMGGGNSMMRPKF